MSLFKLCTKRQENRHWMRLRESHSTEDWHCTKIVPIQRLPLDRVEFFPKPTRSDWPIWIDFQSAALDRVAFTPESARLEWNRIRRGHTVSLNRVALFLDSTQSEWRRIFSPRRPTLVRVTPGPNPTWPSCSCRYRFLSKSCLGSNTRHEFYQLCWTLYLILEHSSRWRIEDWLLWLEDWNIESSISIIHPLEIFY